MMMKATICFQRVSTWLVGTSKALVPVITSQVRSETKLDMAAGVVAAWSCSFKRLMLPTMHTKLVLGKGSKACIKGRGNSHT